MPAAVTLQLFAKAPVAGMVKTRLGSSLSADDAATLHARMVEHAAAQVREACDSMPGARGELWCSPDTADQELMRIAQRHGLALRRQPDGDLGERMRGALGTAMPDIAILLGSDAPALDACAIVGAARALSDCDVVVIPAEDGGYVLIGCRTRVPDCFGSMRWSTSEVMSATRAKLQACGARWRELDPVWDVDTPDDLERLAANVRFSHLLDGLKTAGGSRNVEKKSPALII